jgi:hypothetical protein
MRAEAARNPQEQLAAEKRTQNDAILRQKEITAYISQHKPSKLREDFGP